MKKNRRVEIDIVKGIGIILMIFGHVFTKSIFDDWIHGFNMPLFFLLSGILFKKKKSLKIDLIGKIKSILVPYFSLSIFHLIIYSIKEFICTKSMSAILKYLLNIFWVNSDNIAICGAVWFLTAFFFTNLIVILIEYCIKNSKVKSILYIFITLLGFIISRLKIMLPLSICQGMIGVGFFYIGKKINIKENILKPNFIIGLCLFIIGTIIICLNHPINMRTLDCKNEILFLLGATIMTISLLKLSGLFKNSNNFIINEITFIGKNSIIYMGFNQLIIIFLNNVPFINRGFVMFILVLLMLRLIAILVDNSKVKFLLGKK